MPLTDTMIRNAKPDIKPKRIYDSGGLYLEVSPSGGKLWRFKYRIGIKETRLALGIYPEISLKDARERRDIARSQLSHGIDPNEHKKALKAAKITRGENSFEIVAREWFAKNKDSWAPTHASKIIERFQRDVFPWMGGRPIADITAPEILSVLRRIESRSAIETAHRAKGNISQVMRYAISTGRAARDPCPDLKGALATPQKTHFAAITDPKAIGGLLRTIDGYKGTFIVRCALLLAPMLFVRPGELRKAEWSEIDLDKGEWRYLVTKTKTDHLVPLAIQAVAILRDLYAFTGGRRHVFPGRDPQKPMSEATINAALRRMGIDTKTETTGHGFRAMARTILDEELDIKPEIIEHQLAHKVSGSLGAAYNRTKFIKERQTMMQQWADYLDKQKAGAEIIQLVANANV